MIDYVAVFTNTDLAAFPDTAAVNASGPSATDGTEFVKLMIDDIWGAKQAQMNHAGLTPDGVTEADGTSQIVESLQLGFGGFPGQVVEWNLASDPGVTGHRCLLLQGQGILRANYAALDAAVYVGDGNNAAVAAGGGFYYRADDAAGVTPNIAGIYLILPESRGVVPRGLDTAASIDPDGASRYLGDLQADALLIHGHTTPTYDTDSGASNTARAGATNPVGTITTTNAGTSTENRMYNRSTKFAIWY